MNAPKNSRESPGVSVVIPTYNIGPFIGAAIDSVLAQGFQDFELLVIDDGSSDDTPDIADGFDDPRVRVYRRAHRGPTYAMNEAIERAQGRWIAFLDGDDLWMPEKLERHIEVMTARPDLDLTFCLSRMIDECGRDLHITSPRWSGPLTYRDLLISNPAANGSSIVVNREALVRAGGFDTAFAAVYDQELWLRLALLRRDNIACIPEVLTLYRRRVGQITADASVMERGWRQMMNKHRQLQPDIVAEVESHSRSNLCRYLAAIAYESGHYQIGLGHIKESIQCAPWHFLRTRRSYLVVCALVAKALWARLQGVMR